VVIDQQVTMTRCQALAWLLTTVSLGAMVVDVVWGGAGHAVGRLGVVLAIFAATMHVRTWLRQGQAERLNAFDLGRDVGREERVRNIR